MEGISGFFCRGLKRNFVDNAGESYQLADPSTWAKQADMAARGDWKSFFEYQDKLQGGKEV